MYERGNVFLKLLDLIAQLRPRYVVIENVRGLLSAPYIFHGQDVHGGALAVILERLEVAGYAVSFNLYNTANFGTPQIRERVVLIGKLVENESSQATATLSLPLTMSVYDAAQAGNPNLAEPDHISQAHIDPEHMAPDRIAQSNQNAYSEAEQSALANSALSRYANGTVLGQNGESRWQAYKLPYLKPTHAQDGA